MAESSTVRTSSFESNTSAAAFLYHGSCNKCHHFHKAKQIKLPSSIEEHVRYSCDNCHSPIFGANRTSTQVSLASQLTSSSELGKVQQFLAEWRGTGPTRRETLETGPSAAAILDWSGSISSGVAQSGIQAAAVVTEDFAKHTTSQPKETKKTKDTRVPKVARRASNLLHRLRTHLRKPFAGLETNTTSSTRPITMVDSSMQTDPITLAPPSRTSSGLRPLSTQLSMPEIPEEESPLANISPEVFTDHPDDTIDDPKSAKLRAHRAEQTKKKRILNRIKYQTHCHGCNCPDNTSASVSSNRASHGGDVARGSPIIHSPGRSNRGSDRLATSDFLSQTMETFGAHFLSPQPRIPSPDSSVKSLGSATTLNDRRSSAQSSHLRRSSSYPRLDRDVIAGIERVRPAMLAYSFGENASSANGSVVGARNSFRHSGLQGPISEEDAEAETHVDADDEPATDMFSHIGAVHEDARRTDQNETLTNGIAGDGQARDVHSQST